MKVILTNKDECVMPKYQKHQKISYYFLLKILTECPNYCIIVNGLVLYQLSMRGSAW